MAGQRTNYLSWDEYFMGITALAAIKSPYNDDGACLVDKNHRILSVGYQDIPMAIKNNSEESSKEFVVDSLSNALYTFQGRRQEFEGGTLYLSSYPNYNQSRQIAQAKLSKVVYGSLSINSKEEQQVSKIILDSARVNVSPYWADTCSLSRYREYLEKLRTILKKNIGKDSSPCLTNDEYFMAIATLSALRSKDPSTQVGACLVDCYDRILSIAYNGTPFGMTDDELPWDSLGESFHDLVTTKDPYIVHAEMNVFDNYRGNQDDLRNAKLYLIYSPCLNCTKRISVAGLERIIYLREYTKNGVSKMSSRWLARARTLGELYNEDHDYTKEECLKLFEETTKCLKK